MKKLNTYTLYDLAVRVHPLTEATHAEGMTLETIAWTLLMARGSLKFHVQSDSFFSSSLKRAAVALLDTIQAVGIPAVLPWEGEGGQYLDPQAVVQSWHISSLNESAKTFETVLANELPGLATYHVLQKGIYSTDDLLTRADHHLSDSMRAALPGKASHDICEAGKCLAFELATSSAFHMWRALETVMDEYHRALTGKSFEDAKVTRTWREYIKALEAAKADNKITAFLDHIRHEYRNPVAHPSVNVSPEEAVDLFSAGLSAISQAMRATVAAWQTRALPATPTQPGVIEATPAAN